MNHLMFHRFIFKPVSGINVIDYSTLPRVFGEKCYPPNWKFMRMVDFNLYNDFGEKFICHNNRMHSKYGPAFVTNNTEIWYWHGSKHRAGGPAEIRKKEYSIKYYSNDCLHRTDGPAVVDRTGEFWYFSGFKHRTDGPAAIYASGLIEYYAHGKLHRDNAPAIIDHKNSIFVYVKHGQTHRDNGPAVILENAIGYFTNNELTKIEFNDSAHRSFTVDYKNGEQVAKDVVFTVQNTKDRNKIMEYRNHRKRCPYCNGFH